MSLYVEADKPHDDRKARQQPDWPIGLLGQPASGAAGGMAGGAFGLYVVKPMIDLPSGLGPLAFVALVGVGVVLGQVVGARLFRPSSGGPPDSPPPA